MDKRNLAFDRTNYILLAVSMAVVVIGFLLMTGPGSTDTVYNPDIFSARRIKLAPAVVFVGFVSMIYAIVRKPKDVPGGIEEKPATLEEKPATDKEKVDELV